MSAFPVNVATVLETRLKTFMPQHDFVYRRLEPIDGDKTVGIMMLNWVPKEETIQIGDQQEPVLNTYQYRILNMVQHTDEELGNAEFAVDAKTIRVIVMRDATFHASLTGLKETLLGTVEQVKRFGINRQSFNSMEVRGRFVYVAATDFWVETESRKL